MEISHITTTARCPLSSRNTPLLEERSPRHEIVQLRVPVRAYRHDAARAKKIASCAGTHNSGGSTV